MRIARTDTVADIPAPQARTLMRAFYQAKPEEDIDRWLPDDPRQSGDIARALAEVGLLECKFTDGRGQRWWETTIAGNALGGASFRKPITRATAERHLAGVIGRAAEFNRDSRYLVDVASVVVFGSYLDPEVTELGDLDLAVALEWRMPAGVGEDSRSKAVLDYAYGSGQGFSTLTDALCWPETEAIRFLRKRCSSISISQQDVAEFTDRWKLVYSK